VNWKLFADLAEVAGTDEVTVDGDPETVEEALDDLLDAHPDLAGRVLDDDGSLREHINLLRNGESVDEGLGEPINPDDELALFPPVTGG
jgi:molybdopterin synthase sulfur carrier subunit